MVKRNEISFFNLFIYKPVSSGCAIVFFGFTAHAGISAFDSYCTYSFMT